ncbi:hypothetical protein Ancab_033822 [Ancistrocladus abbreviatus]
MQDFPEDPTKRLDDFVDYVENNSVVFKWIVLLTAYSQVTSFFMAVILQGMEPEYQQYYINGDDDHPYNKLPVFISSVRQTPLKGAQNVRI